MTLSRDGSCWSILMHFILRQKLDFRDIINRWVTVGTLFTMFPWYVCVYINYTPMRKGLIQSSLPYNYRVHSPATTEFTLLTFISCLFFSPCNCLAWKTTVKSPWMKVPFRPNFVHVPKGYLLSSFVLSKTNFCKDKVSLMVPDSFSSESPIIGASKQLWPFSKSVSCVPPPPHPPPKSTILSSIKIKQNNPDKNDYTSGCVSAISQMDNG